MLLYASFNDEAVYFMQLITKLILHLTIDNIVDFIRSVERTVGETLPPFALQLERENDSVDYLVNVLLTCEELHWTLKQVRELKVGPGIIVLIQLQAPPSISCIIDCDCRDEEWHLL